LDRRVHSRLNSQSLLDSYRIRAIARPRPVGVVNVTYTCIGA
jgi:hypothetical protein